MSQPATPTFATEAEISSFQKHLFRSKRILALCGAGLSAASGLPTFRGAGGMWRNHVATDLATHEAFEKDPGLVWQFYAYRRHMALKAEPNPAHVALARLARKKDNFACLTQNVDGLSTRANHPADMLHLLHGSLMDIKCDDYPHCDYIDQNNLTDPLCPALDVSSLEPSVSDKTGAEATESLYSAMNLPSSISVKDHTAAMDPATKKQETIPAQDLPHCPKCNKLLRPGVVWFGEPLPEGTLEAVDEWIASSDKIDLMMVIGTTAEVWPAAGFIGAARQKGARVAVINMDSRHLGGSGTLKKKDWMFQGDAGQILPILFEGVLEN
ncbi:MAG: hypothetical protein M1818_005261 [Claussenomyces sp. TS43310]|nr:MAG: hypothetical protein M1818_005261 [Claussenomyces sp. TS43310]